MAPPEVPDVLGQKLHLMLRVGVGVARVWLEFTHRNQSLELAPDIDTIGERLGLGLGGCFRHADSRLSNSLIPAHAA